MVFDPPVSNLSINAGGTTPTLTVELVDPAGNPGPAPSGGQTLSLTTTSAVGSFSQSGSPVTQVVIPAGQSTATFQYSDSRAGTPTITVGQAQDDTVGGGHGHGDGQPRRPRPHGRHPVGGDGGGGRPRHLRCRGLRRLQQRPGQ